MEWSIDSDEYDEEEEESEEDHVGGSDDEEGSDSAEVPHTSESDDESDEKVENGNGKLGDLKLQKVNRLAKLVPYRDKLESIRVSMWEKLKQNLCEAIITQDQVLVDWIEACHQYVTTFGLAFTKREHILLVKICYRTLVSMEHDFPTIRSLLVLSTKLLMKPFFLTRDDLQLDWRPLYRLYHQLSSSPHLRKQTVYYEDKLLTEVTMFVTSARIYFPKEATGEMLADWRQFMCIYSSKFDRYLYLFMLFLPVVMPPEEHSFGWKLWFEDFMNLWLERPNQDHTSQNLFFLHIFSGIAKNGLGFIDWTPYLPMILQRLKKRFNAAHSSTTNMEITMCAQWITYMISPDPSSLQISALAQYFKFKFVNHKNLSCRLLDEFIRRLRFERKRTRKPWWHHTPESHLLTDQIVVQFATFISTQLERVTFGDFELEHLFNLSLISSEEMTKQVIEKFDLAEERIFEPNRLKLALGLFSVSLFPMLSHEQYGTQHRIHVIPILSKLIQSINTNDQTLCFLHLIAIRSILLLGIPMQNCSQYVKKKGIESNSILDASSVQILKESVQLEQFPQEFLRLCFTIIECNNDDLLTMSQKSLSLKELIFEVLVYIFNIIPEEKFNALADELLNYCTKSINENMECCSLMEKMLEACLLTDKTGKIFEKLFRAVTANVISAIDEQTKYSDICQSEFIYNWRLLQTSVSFNGQLVLPLQQEIIDLLRRIYEIDFEDNFEHNNLLSDVLSVLFYHLTGYYLLNFGFEFGLNKSDPDFAFKRLMNFPHKVKLKDLALNWHVPNQAEIDFAKRLFKEFIKPEMTLLEQWTLAQAELSTAQVEKSLGIILSFLGCVQCLPLIGDAINYEYEMYYNLPDIFAIDLFDGENFRDNLIILAQKIFHTLKDSTSDNVTLIQMLIEIIESCLFSYSENSPSKSDFNIFFKTLLRRDDASLPSVQIFKINQYQLNISAILKKWSNWKFTSIHPVAMDLLVELSTCSSSKIRTDSQAILLEVLDTFSWSYKLIIPRLLENLKAYERDYDAFKGTLYLMYGTKFESILLSRNWAWLNRLWPALVEVNYAEKPKIADLFDTWFLPLFTGHYFTVPIELGLLGGKLADMFPKLGEEMFRVPTGEEIERLEAGILEKNLKNHQLYLQLIEKIVDILESQNLHWRFFHLGFSLLSLLIRYDTTIPRPAVELFLENLVHDSIQIRTTAVVGLKKILFLMKPTRELCVVDPTLLNIEVYKYDSLPLDCLRDREQYEGTIFYDKNYDGYRDGIPSIVAKSNDPDYSEYGYVADWFRDEKFLDMLFDLHSVENLTTIEVNRVKLFKHLFQIFKLFNADLIFPRIEALLAKNKDNYDKLAMEILTGLVRASPWLRFDDLMVIKDFLLTKVFDKFLIRFNKESYDYWYYLFQMMFAKRDMRRWLCVFEYFFNDTQNPLTASSCGPYYQASFLNFVSNALLNNWKFTSISERVLHDLEKHLSHSYKFIRTAVAYTLCIIFHHKLGIGFTVPSTTSQPDCGQFIERVKSKLDQSLGCLFTSLEDDSDGSMAAVKSALFDNEQESGQQLHHFLDTISTWVHECANSKNVLAAFGFSKLLSYLLLVQTTNDQLQENVKRALTDIAIQIYRPAEIDSILTDITKLCSNWNWHTRDESSIFIHNFAYNNLFVLLNHNPAWIDSLIRLVLGLLQDEVIEVRDSARTTLRDFIKWDIVSDERKRSLIQQFKANSLLQTTDLSTGPTNELVLRHSGVLGLCAFVYAYSTELPDIVPDVVLFLSKRVSDPQPIQKTITTALRWFKKTHEPYWIEHKKKFTDQQLAELSNVLISSSCFT